MGDDWSSGRGATEASHCRYLQRDIPPGSSQLFSEPTMSRFFQKRPPKPTSKSTLDSSWRGSLGRVEGGLAGPAQSQRSISAEHLRRRGQTSPADLWTDRFPAFCTPPKVLTMLIHDATLMQQGEQKEKPAMFFSFIATEEPALCFWRGEHSPPPIFR